MARGEAVYDVRIVGLPIAVQSRSQEQHAELLREFALLDIGARALEAQPRPSAPVPTRLVTAIDDLTHRFGAIAVAPDAHRDAAAARGEATVDLTYVAPIAVGAACESLSELLDEADDFCRDGDRLLTLAATDELIAFRHWFLSEFARQLSGERPTSWPDYVRMHGVVHELPGVLPA